MTAQAYAASVEAAESLAEGVYFRLRDMLMRGEFAPHERVKVRDLAGRMGTSETPVREALFMLAHDRAIEIKPRFFIRVARLTYAEYLEIRDIRLQLEPLAAEFALSGIDPEAIAALEQIHAQLIQAERSRDWQTALKANFDFHFSLYQRSGRPTLVGVLQSLWLRVGPMLSELYPSAPPEYAEQHQHEAILNALRDRDSHGLRAAVRMDLIEGGRNLRNYLQRIEQETDHHDER